MFVCICNSIRENDIRTAVRQGPGCAETLYARLGHQPQCRQCLDDAEEIILDELASLEMAL